MAYFKSPDITKSPERSSQDYLNPSRSPLVNHLKTEVKKKPGHTIDDFLTSSIWSWLYHYVKSRFGRKYPYPSYQAPETGVHALPTDRPIRIAVASDWATDTADSFAVARKMKTHKPDYTIHVGDTYFVGAPAEIMSNFVADGSPWVRGHLGSFALLGNHEMYARGVPFFKQLLPTLGLRAENGAYLGQDAGYFCLQTEHWRILGLDTGYHSTGAPLLEFVPGLEPDCRFDSRQMDWLANVVNLGDPADKRGLLILTHHQYCTAFTNESDFVRPAQQLASLLGPDRTVLWLWGHEHKLAFFGKMQADEGLFLYGRCIGNGGTPIEIDSANFKPAPQKKGYQALVAVDNRRRKVIGNRAFGFNGYVVLTLDKASLTLAYHDQVSHLLTETWQANLDTGTIQGDMQVPADTELAPVNDKAWVDAVR